MDAPDNGPNARLSALLESLLALAALAMVAIVVYQIFARGFSMSIRWTEELARLVCIWATFLAMPVLMRRDGLIRIEYFFNHLPRPAKLWVLRAEYAVTAALMIFMTVLTIRQMIEAWDQTSAGLVWSMGYFTMPIALAAALGVYFQFASRRRLLSVPDADASEHASAGAAS